MGLGVGDEFRNGFSRNRRVNLHDTGHTADARDRRDIANEVEVELEHRRIDGICYSNQQQRVTVRGCPHDRLGGNAAASALGVLHRAEIEKWWPIIKAAGIKAE